MACVLSYLYSYISPFIMYCLKHLLLVNKVVDKHLSMTSLLALWKPTYPPTKFHVDLWITFEVMGVEEEEDNNWHMT